MGLGVEVFEAAYDFLKKLQDGQSGGGGASYAQNPGGMERSPEKDEEEVLRQLTNILGEDNLHMWSLIDQLIFCEDLRNQR